MSLPTSPDPARSVPRMPLAIFGAFVLSIVSLLLTAGFLPLPLVFVAVCIASYFSEIRLVGNNPNRWFLRLAIMLIIYLANPEQARDSDWAIGTPRLRNLFAQYYAAEVAIQFWRYHPPTETSAGDQARPRLLVLILSGLILLSASNTFDDRWIRFVVPAFLALLVVGLYAWRDRSLSLVSSVWRAVAVTAALTLGFVSYWSVYGQRGQLMEMTSRLNRVRPNQEGNGMAQMPRLSETFDLRGTATRVLRIQNFSGNSHWRGMAFTEYRNGRWGPSYGDRRYQAATESITSPSAAFRRRDISEITVTRLTSGNELIYAPLSLATLNLQEEDVNAQVALETGGPFRVRAATPYIYLVSAAGAEGYQGILATPLTPQLRARCLSLPDDFDPQVIAFARRVVRESRARTPREKVAAITAHLITNHQYSLRYRPTTKNDPIVGFILSTPPPAAHCEYFAASAALMLRAVGVPTRYVTGYLAHESEGGSSVIVRQRDAHAWCEAYLDGIGWVTVDATPGTGRPDITPEKVEKWRTAYEWVQDRWAQLLGFLSDLTGNTLNRVVVVMLALLIAWGIIVYLRSRRARQLVPAWHYSAASPDLAVLADRFSALLSRLDAPPPPSLPFSQHLQELAANAATRERLNEFLPVAQHWVRQYDRARWGRIETEKDAEDTRRLLSELLEKAEIEATRVLAPAPAPSATTAPPPP